MNTQTTQKSLPIYRGELALLLAVAINSFGVVLMLYSGTGISAISSVPYAFSCVFPKISLGTWTYIFQGLLVLALMILPTVINISESALRAVPGHLKSASLALGATKIQTIFQVILPAAKSGIITAVVLGTGRAIGEAMAIRRKFRKLPPSI